MMAETEARADKIMKNLCQNWSDRAALTKEPWLGDSDESFDKALYDYPPDMVPFKDHPAYLKLDEKTKETVRALAWISWNRRVVDTEELVVNPALIGLMHGETDLTVEGNDKTAIRQTIVDEYFHSQMHEMAIHFTQRGRGIPDQMVKQLVRPPCVFRDLNRLIGGLESDWRIYIARLAWVVVGELSIYEFLGILSRNPSLQPSSRKMLQLHQQDEAAHASIIAEYMKKHFHEFGAEQAHWFLECLPLAMKAFTKEDWQVWVDVLNVAGVSDANEIIENVRSDPSVRKKFVLNRSFEKIERFLEAVGYKLIPAENDGLVAVAI